MKTKPLFITLVPMVVVAVMLASCDTLAVRDLPGLCFKKKEKLSSANAVYQIDQKRTGTRLKGKLVYGHGDADVEISGFDGAYEEVECPKLVETK